MLPDVAHYAIGRYSWVCRVIYFMIVCVIFYCVGLCKPQGRDGTDGQTHTHIHTYTDIANYRLKRDRDQFSENILQSVAIMCVVCNKVGFRNLTLKPDHPI